MKTLGNLKLLTCIFAATIATTLSSPALKAAPKGGIADLLGFTNNVCFARYYSKSHLANHPRQTVSYIALKRFPKLWQPDPTQQRANETVMSVHVKFASSNKNFEESAFCTLKGGKLDCGIECDGGGFTLEHRTGGKIVLKTGKYGFRVLATGGCGETESDNDIKYVSRKTDDKTFLLHRLDDSQCIAPAKKN